MLFITFFLSLVYGFSLNLLLISIKNNYIINETIYSPVLIIYFINSFIGIVLITIPINKLNYEDNDVGIVNSYRFLMFICFFILQLSILNLVYISMDGTPLNKIDQLKLVSILSTTISTISFMFIFIFKFFLKSNN